MKHRKTFRSMAEARSWRVDAAKAVKDGKLNTSNRRETVEQAGRRWIADAKAGTIRQRGGDREGASYKPSVLRLYERDLERHVFPNIGLVRLSELRRRDVQALVDELVRLGLSGSRVRGAIMPLRTIVRRALEDDELAVNPTTNLRLPAEAGRRERVATAAEAEVLLAALPDEFRALWATAIYAGLRRGELRALRWGAIDTDVTVIRVEHSWDDVVGEIGPKSRKGRRTVPVVSALRLELLEHKARTGRRGSDLVFGRTASEPFTPTHVRDRALGAWAAAAVGAFLRQEPLPVEIAPIGLHECRHTYVSLMVDAGFSLERIGDYVGHSSTFMVDRYRHLLEGHEAEAAERFDAYLTGKGAQRGAHPVGLHPKVGRVQGE